MSWEICINIAVFAVILTVVFCFYLGFTYRKGRKLNMIHAMLGGCFVAAFFTVLAPLSWKYDMGVVGAWGIIVPAIQKTIKLFGADGIFGTVYDSLELIPEQLKNAYIFMILLVQFAAPLLSVGFILSFFKNICGYARYLFTFWKHTYVFSSLTPKSVGLACDIKNKFPNCRIVFADAYSNSGEQFDKLFEKAKEIKAIFFKKEIGSIRLGAVLPKKKLCFFAITENDMTNVEQGVALIKKYNYRPDTDLYVFSHTVEGELILANENKGEMKVRRVNLKRLTVSNILVEEGSSFFDSARPIDGSNDKRISAVIVGMGTYGTEMLKSLSWYCQMDGYRLRINAFDRDDLARERMEALCPELLSKEYNHRFFVGEAGYDIDIHAGCDVDTNVFAKKIGEIKDATLAIVSLGSDEKNIEVAANLRMLFARNGISPKIYAICNNADARKHLAGTVNFKDQPYDIKCIGDVDSVMTVDVIMRSEIEKAGYNIHKSYNRDRDADAQRIENEKFWKYEYCYYSSIASAIHEKARVHCGILGAEKLPERRTENENKINSVLEHKRWNAYMRSEGYIYSGSDDKKSRSDLAKKHNTLVNYSALTEEYRIIDERITSKE